MTGISNVEKIAYSRACRDLKEVVQRAKQAALEKESHKLLDQVWEGVSELEKTNGLYRKDQDITRIETIREPGC